MRRMSPHIIATVTIDENENCSPEMGSPKAKGSRILYCRKCEGHGEKVILKNHSPQCPYILCNCKSCEKLNYKRLKSFNKRNKEKIELAAALNAKRHANERSMSIDDDEGYSRRSSFCSSKTSSPDMEQQSSHDTTSSALQNANNSEPVTTSTNTNNNTGLEGRSMSLGAMTVMSYDIWKARCAKVAQKREEEKAQCIKEECEEKRSSLSPLPVRKRAHTFVAQSMTNRVEDIPAIATKKLSVDEKSKGKYILLPTIPAMRIFVNEEDEVEKPTPEVLPSTSRPFQLPKPAMLPPLISQAPPPPQQQQHISPFKPVLPSNMSTEQIISSLTLHNTVLQQQQQNNQIMQDLLHNLSTPQTVPTMDVLSMLRLQQQAAALAAALAQASSPVTTLQPQHQQNHHHHSLNLANSPLLPKPIPTTQLLNTFLQTPATLYTNPV